MKLSVGYIIYGLTLLQGISDSEANRHYHFSHWIKTSKTRGTGVYVFDWRLRLSVNQCMKVCQVTKACQFFNYETRPHLCGLIRTDELASVEVEQKPGYVYGNKSEWIQNDINRCDKCNSTGKCISNDLTDKKNNVCENSGCEEPRNVDFQGNMFSTGSNIKSKCKDGFHKLPVGLTIDHQTCAENGTWRPTYPCFKTNQYGESYYYVNHVFMTWFKAKEYCESYGGHLADISSKEEQTFMETMLSSEWLRFGEIMTILRYFIIYYMHVTISVDAAFIKSREPGTWEQAREFCTSFDGKLATLHDIQTFREAAQKEDFTLAPGEELWVGASLQYGNWSWSSDSELEFKEKHVARKGCLILESDNVGTHIESITPMKCLDYCGWEGQVGLKENYCFCSNDMANVSTNRPGVCHISCSSQPSHMCGGYNSVSVYKPGQRDLNWAKGEPKEDNDCALIRTNGLSTQPELVTGNCNMQTRYLCTFLDNDKCGLNTECIRASAFYSTWFGAANKCTKTNGTFTYLQEPITSDILSDIHRLPSGSFWLALHRSRHWQWIDGQPVDLNDFHKEQRFGHAPACATIKMIDKVPTLSGGQCQHKLHFVCQYDYITNSDDTANPGDTYDLLDDVVTSNYGLMSDQANEDSHQTTEGNPPESKSGGMYMALGFVSGMLCVLVLGLIVYLVCRCRMQDYDKHQRLDGQNGQTETQSVSYSSKDDSIHISRSNADITYDTVYDLETESPFRRTQRLIRMGSANSWRNAPARRTSDDTRSPRTGYTWRGMIGGGIEIINTELRHPIPDQSDYREASTASLYDGASYNRTRAIIENTGDVSPDEFIRVEAVYDLPERSDSFDYERKTTRSVRNPQSEDESFLELHTARHSGSHEDNIYATIKKTFQKIEEEIAEQARQVNNDDNDKIK
ncbi:C-type lectin domain 4 member F [Mactra antiquata]